MKAWGLILILMVLTSTANAERKALLIGNAAYETKPLRNPGNDVKDMKQVLQRLGFTVTDKTNLSKRAMKQAIRQFSNGLSANDEALFYFSGHGASIDGQNYLIPLHNDIYHEDEVSDEAVSLNFVLNKLTGSNSKLNIVILDACRDNPFQSRFKSTSRGLTRLKRNIHGTIVAFAASDGGVSEDGNRNNGTYTEYLIKHLPTPNITINQMFNRVRADVNQATGGKQFPVEENGLLSDVRLAGVQQQHQDESFRQEPETPVNSMPVISAPAVEKRQAFEPKMRLIQGGRFEMGCVSGKDCDSDEKVHSVQVKDFWIGQYEVTFDEWQACVNDGGCQSNKQPDDEGWGRGKRPVINVSWHDANEYAAWLSRKTGKQYRLPTEAEWEYAARAGSQTRYHFGDNEANLCRYGNHADTSTDYSWRNDACSDGVGKQTALVGSFQSNAWQLYDTIGNVWEWTCSAYDSAYAGAEVECVNDNDSRSRVLRGGSWLTEPWSLRSALRGWNTAAYRGDDVGFRLARTR